MSPYDQYTTGDPEFARILAARPPPPETTPTISELRAQIQASLNARPKQEFDVVIRDFQVPVKDGSILVKNYTPITPPGGDLPLLLWFHGGGFIFGHPDDDDAWCSNLAQRLGLSVLNVGYRLAPEFTYPAAIEDSYSALKWAVQNSTQIGANISRGLILGGGSAGGNIATVLALQAHDDPTFKAKITGQLLNCPYLCLPNAYPEKYKQELASYEELSTTAPIVSKEIMELSTKCYAAPDPNDWRVSPLIAPSHSNLPPTVIQVAGWDPLRDEGIVYEKILREAGVQTQLHIYPGAPHMFQTIFLNAQATKKFTEDTIEGIMWLNSLVSA